MCLQIYIYICIIIYISFSPAYTIRYIHLKSYIASQICSKENKGNCTQTRMTLWTPASSSESLASASTSALPNAFAQTTMIHIAKRIAFGGDKICINSQIHWKNESKTSPSSQCLPRWLRQHFLFKSWESKLSPQDNPEINKSPDWGIGVFAPGSFGRNLSEKHDKSAQIDSTSFWRVIFGHLKGSLNHGLSRHHHGVVTENCHHGAFRMSRMLPWEWCLSLLRSCAPLQEQGYNEHQHSRAHV